MKWYGIAYHLPSKTQKFLASAQGSPYLAVSAWTTSVTSSRSPSAWNCATIRAYGVYLGTDKLGHFTDMGKHYYREYRKSLDEGKSEDEAVAAKPTKDFDAAWVHQGNFVTGDTMTRLAYQSLKGG